MVSTTPKVPHRRCHEPQRHALTSSCRADEGRGRRGRAGQRRDRLLVQWSARHPQPRAARARRRRRRCGVTICLSGTAARTATAPFGVEASRIDVWDRWGAPLFFTRPSGPRCSAGTSGCVAFPMCGRPGPPSHGAICAGKRASFGKGTNSSRDDACAPPILPRNMRNGADVIDVQPLLADAERQGRWAATNVSGRDTPSDSDRARARLFAVSPSSN